MMCRFKNRSCFRKKKAAALLGATAVFLSSQIGRIYVMAVRPRPEKRRTRKVGEPVRALII